MLKVIFAGVILEKFRLLKNLIASDLSAEFYRGPRLLSAMIENGISRLCSLIHVFLGKASAVTFFLIFSYTNAYALNPTDKSHQLKQIKQQISGVQQEISQDDQQTNALAIQLKSLNQDLKATQQHLNELLSQLNQQNMQLTALKTDQQTAVDRLDKQKTSLVRQLRAMYIYNRQDSLKVLFNENDPRRVNRTLNYYYYFNQARLKQMAALKVQLNELEQRAQKIQLEQQQIATLIAEQQNEQVRYHDLIGSRKVLLQKLAEKIQREKIALENLVRNKNALERMIVSLQATQRQTNVASFSNGQFAKMQGKLNWPTRGVIGEAYNSTIKGSGMKHHAVMINANENQNVYAIYAGEVIFSGVLRGFGLLTIIDHGQGYLSLYAKNNSLYLRAGDRVSTGQLIATVGGKNGGYQKSGLYFSIRHDGKPLDPALWCR